MTDGATAPVRHGPTLRVAWPTAVNLLVLLSVVLLNLVQQPGHITFDTKLDLQIDPGDLLARSLSLWNPDWALGGLQNQASGYLFPMGPAFMLGEHLGVPMWVWQRLWSATIMLVAYEGARRLAASWPGIGTAGTILAGLTYMLSPRVLTTVGGLSGETLPAAVLPWTVLPLVLYLRGGLRGWVAFVLSAATIPWMGGQNATLVVACLVLPALLLLLAHGRTVGRRARDLACWGALVAIASLWWLVPLLLLGSYAPPFLDFIESADNTAGATGWLSSLRGTSHWVAFFPGGGRVGWVGGYELASSSLLLIPTVLVAAVGLAGLLQRDLWQRRVLAVSVVCGLAVLTAGSGGWAGSVFSDVWLQALDTSLAPLRNIHKFDPVVRLPLSLGVAAWVTSGVPRTWRASPSRAALPARGIAVAVATTLVLAAAGPAAAGSLRTDHGFRDIPASWRAAVAFLEAQPEPTRTLVLPGVGFAVQTWGRTIDEPMQVLDPPPWLARAQITVAPAGTQRILDSVEQSMAEARPQERLADALASLGVTHVIVRHDLDPEETDAPSPDLVQATMSAVPGARAVGTFGGGAGEDPPLVIYELDAEQEPRVAVQDWGTRSVVSGGPEVVPDLLAAGLVGADQAVVLGDEQPDIVTDSLRRIERSFGRVHDARSGVMTADDPYRVERPVHDYTGGSLPEGRTVAVYDGAAEIRASSSAGYADVLGAVRPEQHPYSAFDRSIYTAWTTAPLSNPIGQWVEVRFDEATDVDEVSLAFDTFTGADVTSVRVETNARSVVADVEPNGSVPALDLDDPAATRMRVSVLGAGADTGQVRLSDVRIAGHDVTRSLSLPGLVSAETAVFVSSEPPRRACAVTGEEGEVTCDLNLQRETSETPGFDRTINVSEAGSWRLAGRAVATHGPGVEQLFAPLSEDLVSVTASSTYGGDPAVTPAGAVDGRPETGWTSAPGDPAAALQLTWGPRRTVTGVALRLSPGHPGRLPTTVVVDPGPRSGEPQLVATTGPQAGAMQPVRTDRLRVTAVGDPVLQGVGVSELEVAGIEDLRYQADLDAATGTQCGFGPTVDVAGQVVQTRLEGTLQAVRSGAEIEVVPCGDDAVSLPTGSHRITVSNPPGFAVTDLTLTPSVARPAAVARIAPQVRSWSATERRVDVAVERESVLGVSESFNPGWVASVAGNGLRPVVLDGWRQGFVLPAGTSGVVTLEFAPQTAYRTALVAGLVLAGALVLLALGLGVIDARRRYRGVFEPLPADHGAEATRPPGRAVAVVGLVVLAAVSLPLAAGAAVGRLTRDRGTAVVSLACAGGLLFAAVIALSAGSSVVVPPVASDVVAAAVVGTICGRVMFRA